MFDSLINIPKQGLLQNVAVKESECHRISFSLFETIVECSDPERASIKQVVYVWKINGS